MLYDLLSFLYAGLPNYLRVLAFFALVKPFLEIFPKLDKTVDSS